MVEGPSVADLVKAADPAIDAELSAKLDATVAKMEAIARRAPKAARPTTSRSAKAMPRAMPRCRPPSTALVDQTKSIERAVAALKLDAIAFEGSDSLDCAGQGLPVSRRKTDPARRRATSAPPAIPERHMLICHCNLITEKEIEDGDPRAARQDPWSLIVPAKVYHTLQKRGRCCGCFPNVVETIIRVTENYHLRSEASGVDVVSHLDRVRGLRGRIWEQGP